eukprot:1005900-Amorphochlora_amoeboformis.AAC.2
MSITKILPRLPALAFLLAAAYLVATLFHHKSLKLSVQPTSRVSARLVAQAQGMRSQSRSETRMRALDSTDPVLLGLKLANPVTGMIKPLMSSMSKVQAGTYDEDATEELINREVTSSPVVVFSYGLSPFCTKAIEVGVILNLMCTIVTYCKGVLHMMCSALFLFIACDLIKVKKK